MQRKEERFFPPISEGLSMAQVKQQERNGRRNIQPKPITKTIPEIMMDNIFTRFNAFNFAIALALIFVHAYRDLLFIVAILCNIAIGIFQEIRSKHLIERLSVLTTSKVVVRRDGKEQSIAIEELVLDDLMRCSMGAQVCADAIIRQGSVEVNESLLTGESEPIMKREGDLLRSGSFLVSGNCYAQVEHLGKENFATKVVWEAKKYQRFHSALMDALDQVVRFTGYFIIPFAVLLFAHSYFQMEVPLQKAVISVSAALLGMLPKGLVLLTTVSLVVGVIHLAKRKILVQELFAIENLSRVDTICLDKTGTLTEGKMRVTRVIPLQEVSDSVSLHELIGAAEAALQDQNATAEALRSYFDQTARIKAIHQVPFSSSRKWSAVSFEQFGTVFIGAPDILLRHQMDSILEEVQNGIAKGQRVVLVAHSINGTAGQLPEDLKPIALILLEDPIRDNAAEILEFFRSQGVQIKVISGDHPGTVAHIAREAGLKEAEALDVSTVEDQSVIEDAADQYQIFGRVLPGQKKQLIKSLQKKGHVVAMTGDGVNDVLALKAANCSIAMASGSDAAKQISQVVLLENDFAALPYVVMEGRRVVNNITRTASLFLVKTCFSFLLSLVTLFFAMQYPFAPLQLSLVSMFIEGIPSFILTFEPSQEKISGEFLSTVLQRVFPSAVLIVVYSVLISRWITPQFMLSSAECTTLCLYSMGFIWLMQLYRVCEPMNRFRFWLWIGMFLCFYGSAYLAREWLGLVALSLRNFLIFACFAYLSIPLQRLLDVFLSKVKKKIRKKKRD